MQAPQRIRILSIAAYLISTATVIGFSVFHFIKYAHEEGTTPIKTYDLAAGILNAIFMTIGIPVLAIYLRNMRQETSQAQGESAPLINNSEQNKFKRIMPMIYSGNVIAPSLFLWTLRECLKAAFESEQPKTMFIVFTAITGTLSLAASAYTAITYGRASQLGKSMCCVLNQQSKENDREIVPLLAQ